MLMKRQSKWKDKAAAMSMEGCRAGGNEQGKENIHDAVAGADVEYLASVAKANVRVEDPHNYFDPTAYHSCRSLGPSPRIGKAATGFTHAGQKQTSLPSYQDTHCIIVVPPVRVWVP